MRVSEQGAIILGDRDVSQIYNPSCNTLLTSVAAAYRNGAIGLIMSGMGDDGVAGMQAIKMAGGATLAQDAKSSVVFGMNRVAVERGYIHKVMPLAEYPGELMQRAGELMMAMGQSRTGGEVSTLPRLKSCCCDTCGHSFEKEREQTLCAAVCRRMAAWVLMR